MGRKAAGQGRGSLDHSWWVVAIGDELDQDDFQDRDLVRERLASLVARAGVELLERCWVWDESNRAQLLLAGFREIRLAEGLAGRLTRDGVRARVVPAFRGRSAVG